MVAESNLSGGAAREVIHSFLVGRGARTTDAYRKDLEAFARYRGDQVEQAVAGLLACGPEAALRLVLAYAVALRRERAAEATITRRLVTLRNLIRVARDEGRISWSLPAVTGNDITVVAERSPVGDSPHYLFARHPSEVDRLDLQHYALQATIGGDFLAPVTKPGRVLDVGAGTGQWGFDVLRRLPGSLVVGLDVVAGKAQRPPGYHFVKANLLHGLPFVAGAFDFVHQRFLLFGVPLASWPAVVADLARVTRPGGWVELVEFPLEMEGAGPAIERMQEFLRRLAVSGGMDAGREVFDSLGRYLQEVGLEDICWRDVPVRVGNRGDEVGSLLSSDIRAGSLRLFETMQARGLISRAEAHEIIEAAQREVEEGKLTLHLAFAFGRRPGRAP